MPDTYEKEGQVRQPGPRLILSELRRCFGLLSAPELSVAHTFTAGRVAARVSSVFLTESLSTPNDSGLGLVRRFSHRHLRNFTRCVYYPNLPLLITICQYPSRIEARFRRRAGDGLGA